MLRPPGLCGQEPQWGRGHTSSALVGESAPLAMGGGLASKALS